MKNLSGIFPPITTPFNERGQVDYSHLESNLDVWLTQPLAGIVVPGSNSEAAFITQEERIEIWRVCVAKLYGSSKIFIAGTGAETTAASIELTQTAASLGVDAALVLPPYFYKSQLTPEVLITHYRSLADESPIPLLVYNVPAFTGIDFSPYTLAEMAKHERIVGVKDSSANVVKIASLLAIRPDFLVFAGTGSALLPFLSLGAVGAISALSNFASPELVEILNAFTSGDLEKARSLQLSLAEINSAVTARFGVPGLKYAMDRLGLYGGPPRRPLLPLNASGRLEIDRLLKEALLVPA
jgi:4-hydroxy-2-oxoglutarate aldolase